MELFGLGQTTGQKIECAMYSKKNHDACFEKPGKYFYRTFNEWYSSSLSLKIDQNKEKRPQIGYRMVSGLVLNIK